jgi:hypothetical protein
MALARSLWLIAVGCCAALLAISLAVIRPLTLAVVADAVGWLVLLLGCATIGLVVALRRRPNPTGWGRAHDGRQVSVVSSADL